MSTLCNSTLSYPTTWPSESIAPYEVQPWAVRCWRGLLFCALFSVIFLPEFLREGNGAGGSFLYAKAVAGFRFIDLGILALVFTHLGAVACSRKRKVGFPRTLAAPGVAFLLCIAIGIGYGQWRGGTNFFFDWRALALGIGLYFVWAAWIQTFAEAQRVVRLFGVYMAVRIVLLYALYLSGRGETLLGIPIPIFDGPALSAIVFTALLAFSHQENSTNAVHKILWMALAGAAYLIVLLCFRRTYWGEIAAGTAILLLLERRHRLRNFVLIGGALCVVMVTLGRPFVARVVSLDVMQMDGEFDADNADHLHDLLDAWDQVRESPVMGIGVGTTYSTWRIRNWKSESVMVHNAPVHVWLKYGLMGLACYLWFHMALLSWLYRRAKWLDGRQAAFLHAAFAYLAAQFVITLGFAPWPYSELQLTMLTSFILAAAVASAARPSRLTLAGERPVA